MTIRRAVIAGAALAGLAGSAGAAVADEPNAAAEIYAARCATCHSERRVVRKVKAISAADRHAHLKEFMARHYSPGEAARDLLIRYLLARAAQ